MKKDLFGSLAGLGVEIPDVRFFIQIAGDHLAEARKYKKDGKLREMYWQIVCLTDALAMATALMKKGQSTIKKEELEDLLQRGEEIKDEAMALAEVQPLKR